MVICHTADGFLVKLFPCLSQLSKCGPFILCCGGSPQILFRGNCSYVVVDILCSLEVNSGSSYHGILNHLFQHLVLK